VGKRLPPIDTPEQQAALSWSNRRAIARRLHWPTGRLEECERVTSEHPPWDVMWWREGVGGPEQFTADRLDRPGLRLTGATIEELLVEIAAWDDRVRAQERKSRLFRPIVAEQ
jgi:hypothetical protein